MADIAVVMITKNEERRIRVSLAQARKLTDEIIIVDDGSTDGTAEIAAKEYGATVIVHRSDNWLARQRNIGAEQVKAPWFFSMDADEVLCDKAIAKIKAAIAGADAATGAFRIRRVNHFFGKPIRYAGAGACLLRIFRRGARDLEKVQHENWTFEGDVRDIDTWVDHYPYTSMTAAFTRAIQYTSREARAYVAGRDKISWKEIRHGLIGRSLKNFWKSYVKKQGYKDGMHGFMFCLVQNVIGPVMRWCIIWEEAQKQDKLVP